MAISNRELEVLEVIQRYGGQVSYSTVAQALRGSSDYAKNICKGLGEGDYVDITLAGMCKMSPRGLEELLRRGKITLADLEPADDEEAESSQETVASQSAEKQPDASRQEMPQSFAAPAWAPESTEVKCAYCSGRGLDPFGIPSRSSKCTVCGGKGFNCVIAPYATCTVCGGTGRTLGRRVTCTTCRGRGVVPVRKTSKMRRRFGASGGSSASSTLGDGIRTGQVASLSVPRSEQPVSVADQVATHITHFPGVKEAHVRAFCGLSKENTNEVLQELIETHRIRLNEDALYYPA